MPNQSTPTSPRFTGWFYDQANGNIELYYRGTLVRTFNATAETIPAAVIYSPNIRAHVARLGTVAAVASDGAGAIIENMAFVAPAALKIVSAWRMNISASDVTKGTATTSASYRRMTLITNTAGAGSGTDIVASLNATASAASKATRSFTTVASTVPAGAIVLASHLTVGAVTADGTDIAAGIVEFSYELV